MWLHAVHAELCLTVCVLPCSYYQMQAGASQQQGPSMLPKLQQLVSKLESITQGKMPMLISSIQARTQGSKSSTTVTAKQLLTKLRALNAKVLAKVEAGTCEHYLLLDTALANMGFGSYPPHRGITIFNLQLQHKGKPQLAVMRQLAKPQCRESTCNIVGCMGNRLVCTWGSSGAVKVQLVIMHHKKHNSKRVDKPQGSTIELHLLPDCPAYPVLLAYVKVSCACMSCVG